MRRILLGLVLSASCLTAFSQSWESIRECSDYIWGEGWGTTVDEADREALFSLTSKINISVVSDFRQIEGQVLSSEVDEHFSKMCSSTAAYSNVALSNTHRIVIKKGKRSHVGRWIHRDDLEEVFRGRESRILEYEQSAGEALTEGRLDDALRCHYWAYVLLRSLQRPSALRSEDGSLLLNSIPESICGILDGLNIRKVNRTGEEIRLRFTFAGIPVEGLDFRYFDGARWSPMTSVRKGEAILLMAPGALAETIQIRVEYAYCGDSAMDGELHDTMRLLDLKPLRKSFIIFTTRS